MKQLVKLAITFGIKKREKPLILSLPIKNLVLLGMVRNDSNKNKCS